MRAVRTGMGISLSWRRGRPRLRKHGRSRWHGGRRGHPRGERWLIDKRRRRKDGSGRRRIVERARQSGAGVGAAERNPGAGVGCILERRRGNRRERASAHLIGASDAPDTPPALERGGGSPGRRKSGSGRGRILERRRRHRGGGRGRILNRRGGRSRCVVGAKAAAVLAPVDGGSAAAGGFTRAECAIGKNQAEHREEVGRDAACKEPAPLFDFGLQGLPGLVPFAVVELDV